MASRYRWRQQLLGSLQGQLQLATYLVVFLCFTGASSVGLLIGQRNLLANDQQLARVLNFLKLKFSTYPISKISKHLYKDYSSHAASKPFLATKI